MDDVRRVLILGVRCAKITYSEVLSRLLSWRNQGKCGIISLVNPHSIMVARHDPEMDKALNYTSLILADGIGITLASKILGGPRIQRIIGPELMLKLCDWSQYYGFRHYFFGGNPGVAEQLAQKLKCSYPGMQIAGYCCPPFDTITPDQDREMICAMNASKPDIVWVGLGAPKQEKWIYRHRGQIQATAVIGVGAAFDFHSGRKKWAPQWVRAMGLEWVFRLIQEPKRMWRRNLNNAAFLFHVSRQRYKQLLDKTLSQTPTQHEWEISECLYDLPKGASSVLKTDYANQR